MPDGLDGMRLDAGLARLLGLSRTVVATLVEAGARPLDGRAAAKSDRLTAGAWLEVDAARAGAAGARSWPRRGGRGPDRAVRRRRHRRGRQAGRRRRAPEPRLDRPDRGRRAGRARATASPPSAPPSGRASCTGSTSAPPGVMVVAKTERAYTVLKRAFKERTVDKRYHAVVPGPPRPVQRHHRRADRPAPPPRLPVRGRRRRAAERHPLRHARGVPAPRACSTSTWRPAAPTRSGCTSPRCATRASATSPTAPTRRSPKRLGLTRQWLHARSLGFAHPADGRWVEFVSPYPADLAHALDRLRRVTTRGRLALLAACGVVAALVALYAAVRVARAHARARRPGSVRLGPGAGRGRRRLPAAGRGHPAAAGHHGARARAVRRRADRRRRGGPGHGHRGRVPGRPAARADRAALRRAGAGRRRPPSTPRGSGPRAPPRPTRAGSRAGAAGRRDGRGGRVDQAGLRVPRRAGRHRRRRRAATARRRGAGVEAAPPGVTLRELALSPLLPEQADRADPLPDDGPVP